jgi:hypothetical protein
LGFPFHLVLVGAAHRRHLDEFGDDVEVCAGVEVGEPTVAVQAIAVGRLDRFQAGIPGLPNGIDDRRLGPARGSMSSICGPEPINASLIAKRLGALR